MIPAGLWFSCNEKVYSSPLHPASMPPGQAAQKEADSMEKPKQPKHQHPHWLKQCIWIVEAKSFPLFFYGFLTVWGAFVTTGAHSLEASITFATAFFIVWLFGLLLMFEANFKWWKKLICAVVGLFFLGLFTFQQVKRFPTSTPSPKQSAPVDLPAAALIQPPKPAKDYGLIKNGGFEEGLLSWVSNEYEVKNLYVSRDVVGTLETAPVMSLINGAGFEGSKGLVITCDKKPGSEEYKYFAQKIDGLKPNAKYKVNFLLYQGEHAKFNEDSIYMIFDGHWPRNLEPPGEGRILKKKLEKSWAEYSITIFNDARTANTFLIVVNDITQDIRLDDISIELSE